MKLFLLVTILILCSTSCKMILINMMLKDPAVENTAKIKNFQTTNNYSTVNSLILKGDLATAETNLFLGLSAGYYIFDSLGNHICYNGSSTCGGVQFEQLIANTMDSFKVCKSDSINLENILGKTYDLNEKPVAVSQFPTTSYYVVSYWQKFMGGKRGYEEAVIWMEDEIKKDTLNNRFTFIKINTDLQESWGLIPGKKAKLKVKKHGKDVITLDITNVPVKK